MPAKRLSMRKIKEVLRLKWANGLSDRKIARSCGIGRPTIKKYLLKAEQAGLSWPLPDDWDDARLEQCLFPEPSKDSLVERGLPDWVVVHQEMKQKSVTLFLLWQEYRERYPQGYQYSWFCSQYRLWLGKQDWVMRQTHRAGEKLFVDYAGQTVPVVDRDSGEIRDAQIFVAVLGASNYTYAEATWTQALPDWIASHQRTFAYLGRTPEVVVPDNLLAGVSKAHRYEPDINPTYQDLAIHYGVAIVPARVRRPKDKAKVEVGVQIVERWILAALRHQTFFSLAELNQAIQTLLVRLNQRPFKKLPGSREQLFKTLDYPALNPLPATPYVYAQWKKVRVHIDYHVEVAGHYYSVPYTLIKQTLDARLTQQTIELFYRGKRVASHVRSRQKGRYTTLQQHMPPAHKNYAGWSPQRFRQWAEKIGAATTQVITTILSSRRHPQQGYRACLGILRLAKTYGPERLEAASERALTLGTCRYKSIESILKNHLDSQPLQQTTAQHLPQHHDNIRGPGYYH